MPIKKALRPLTLVVTTAALLVAAGPASANHDSDDGYGGSYGGPQTPTPVEPLAECAHGEMSQALAIFGDTNTYTPAPGGLFDDSSEWALSGGARIVSATQPDGTTGGVLELSGKAQATSPPMCITADYPMARLWSRQVSGNDSVSFNVQYYDAETGQWTDVKENGRFAGPYYWDQGFNWSSYGDWVAAWNAYANSPAGQWLKHRGYVTGVRAGWRLSPEMAVTPSADPGWQQVRFTFHANGSYRSRSQIDTFLVDPRASR